MADDDGDRDKLNGEVLGGCKLLKRINKGAMGVVYLAEQIDLKRRAAVKVLDSRFSSDKSYIERFEMEARAAARLSHPNIVRIYDSGQFGDIHYIVYEYIDGGTVQRLIKKRGALQPEESVEYAIQAANGLAAAAQANIIHRDIKPDNLMLTREGVLKIADFGLAKTMAPGQTAADPDLILGTPFYMSPEQAKGTPLDSRSDIYSLGVSMYYMIVGKVPFEADSVIGVLLKQISADRPDPCAVKPDIPSVLGSLIMRMMDKDPANRPQNPEELLRELETVRQILRPTPPPPSLAEISEVPEGERQNFRPLPASRINRLTRVEASTDVLTRIITSIHDDGGVRIDSDNPFPLNTVVEARFRDEGGDEEFSGLGLVRWTTDKAMGVTFVKVQPVNKKGDSLRLSGPMAIGALTSTPIHQRLLRLVYANAGQVMTIGRIAGSLGVGAKMAEEPLRIFERASMIKRHPDGRLEMLWPKDESLQREIVVWIEQHGMP
ncbi:MAG: protein kinase [Planctomycetota bacterium]|nr:protein kinase [Planctomycetota bacterium]